MRSAHGLSKHSEHRKNQRFAFQVEFLGFADGAADLFPHLGEPRKTGQIGLRSVASQLSRHPALQRIGERQQRGAIIAHQRIANAVQGLRIELRIGYEVIP